MAGSLLLFRPFLGPEKFLQILQQGFIVPGFQLRESCQETALSEELSGSRTASGNLKLRLHLGAALLRIYTGSFHPVAHLGLCEGGLHLQLNRVSREELLDAKAHPERHASLRVRVSGFSAYFTTLAPAIQDDVLARTIH